MPAPPPLILFNEGNAADRMGLLFFNPRPRHTATLPVLAATFAVGQELANGTHHPRPHRHAGPSRGSKGIISQQLSTRNVIAETSEGASRTT